MYLLFQKVLKKLLASHSNLIFHLTLRGVGVSDIHFSMIYQFTSIQSKATVTKLKHKRWMDWFLSLKNYISNITSSRNKKYNTILRTFLTVTNLAGVLFFYSDQIAWPVVIKPARRRPIWSVVGAGSDSRTAPQAPFVCRICVLLGTLKKKSLFF